MKTFDYSDYAGFLHRATDDHYRHAKSSIACEQYEMEIGKNEDGSFKYDDVVPPLREDDLCGDNTNILELMRQWDIDNIEACDKGWEEDFNWDRSDLYNDIEDLDGLKEMFGGMKEGTLKCNQQKVSAKYLNKEQWIVHNMIFRDCVAEEMSTTDGGEGTGRLQILMGSGGTGKTFFNYSIISTLSQLYNWTKEKY